MQETKENIRKQLYGFYIAYDLWLSNGAKPGGVFSQNYGLCANLFDYLTLIGSPCEEALEQLHADFRSAGLNEALPFNESKEHYHEERGHNMCYMNPARAAWVRAQMVQAVPVAEVRGWSACRAAMLHAGNFRENANSSTNNFREIAETSTNSSVIPGEVLSAILKFARVRADFDDFDGDRRGIGDCLDEAEQELIITINKYASQLAVEPVVPVGLDERAAYELFMEKRFGESVDRRRAKNGDREYMAWDMALGWIIWCHRAAMLQGGQAVNQTYNLPELIEGMEVSIDVSTCDADLGNRYFGTVTEALELDTAKNGYILLVQDAEPNFDVNGNSPVTPDAWISCSERMPEGGQHVIILCDDAFVLYAQYRDGEFFDVVRNGEELFETQSRNVTHWMLLPEPPQEVS